MVNSLPNSQDDLKNISVIGMGYVGLCLAAGMAKLGKTVYCVDISEDIISKLKNGESPIHEPQLPELVKLGIAQGNLKPTMNIEEAINNTQITFICVGTPSDHIGYIDLSYIQEASEEIGKVLKSKQGYHLISVKSTVLPGTVDSHVIPIIQRVSGKKVGIDFGACMTPEFLKEGDAINDFFNPDKIVIGAYDKRSSDEMYKVWREFWPDKINKDIFVFCDLRTAEMIKYVNNAFLATKISFINEMANLAEIFGVDIKIVSKAIGLDKRIGPLFLNAGLGFGGSCFPKDVKALFSAAKMAGYKTRMLLATLDVNDDQPVRTIELLKTVYKGKIIGKTVALFGLSFKPNTDDVRMAPAVRIANELIREKVNMQVYDPVAVENFKKLFAADNPYIKYFNSSRDALKDTDAVIIVTEWDEFKVITPEEFKSLMKKPILIDGRRIYNPETLENAGVIYRAIGYSKSREFIP